MKKDDIKTKADIENLSKEIETKKQIPKEIREKITSKVFENVIFAVIIIVYLSALNLGMNNIPTETYLDDLKVFSILLLVFTIFLFENAYKKDKPDIWIHGIEIMFITIITTYLIYLYYVYYNAFGTLIFSVVAVFVLYYAIKILIMRRKIIKQYNKSLIDINEIVKR